MTMQIIVSCFNMIHQRTGLPKSLTRHPARVVPSLLVNRTYVLFEIPGLRKLGRAFQALPRLDTVVDCPHVSFENTEVRKLGRAFQALMFLDAIVD